MAGGTTISRLYDFLDGMVVHEYHLDNEFNRIQQWMNGMLGNVNIAADANIEGSKLKVASVPIDRIAEGAYTKVEVDTKMANAGLGFVPDRSVDGIKLKLGSVGLAELGAVAYATGKLKGALGAGGTDGSPIGANLIPNSSFRLGAAYWGDLAGYNITLNHDFLGSYAHRGTSTNASGSFTILNVAVPVGSNAVCCLSAEMYTGGITSGQAGCVVAFYTSANVYIGQTNLEAVNGQGWQRYQIAFTTPANAATMRVGIYMGANTINTSVAWKRLKLESSNEATPYTADGDLWPALMPGVLIPGFNAQQVGGLYIRISAGKPQWSIDNLTWTAFA